MKNQGAHAHMITDMGGSRTKEEFLRVLDAMLENIKARTNRQTVEACSVSISGAHTHTFAGEQMDTTHPYAPVTEATLLALDYRLKCFAGAYEDADIMALANEIRVRVKLHLGARAAAGNPTLKWRLP